MTPEEPQDNDKQIERLMTPIIHTKSVISYEKQEQTQIKQ